MENILVIENLSKTIKKTEILKSISFGVKEGSFHGFIGANGAGKTTTIRSIVGSYSQYSGKILINGINSQEKEAKSFIGYVPERPIFPSKQSVLTYLTYMGTLSNLRKAESKKKAMELLEEFNIMEFAEENPNRLSSGQKKKVILIQALMNEPKLIIMDEPASNLDPIARHELFERLKKLNKKGVTIFITSHILIELEQYVDSVTMISHGNIAFSGSMSDIQNKGTLMQSFLNLVKKGDLNEKSN
ncbi:multidrug ABC transporter ATP-binding protein [Mycoplasma marinum]|uniref:Multidrug ABC transporter ATP-binding protein n=1 Tax=Mycoplasma marinum TaxID=1937190 RepID=A0A4R0XSS9_9MOLU|nr:multidrug ABC transporter ATP-binding protein [Mycoplasma marinum]